MSEPKPCPFCEANGGNAIYVLMANPVHPGTTSHVHCEACGARGPLGAHYADAVEKWNLTSETR